MLTCLSDCAVFAILPRIGKRSTCAWTACRDDSAFVVPSFTSFFIATSHDGRDHGWHHQYSCEQSSLSLAVPRHNKINMHSRLWTRPQLRLIRQAQT